VTIAFAVVVAIAVAVDLIASTNTVAIAFAFAIAVAIAITIAIAIGAAMIFKLILGYLFSTTALALTGMEYQARELATCKQVHSNLVIVRNASSA
jgi:hypothetical protein